jgi:ketosteroid isomerase-like protein
VSDPGDGSGAVVDRGRPRAGRPTPDRLEDALLRTAVGAVVHRYAEHVDTLDAAALAGLFTDDAEVDLLGTRRQGATAIAADVIRSLRGFVATSHHLSGIEVTVVDGHPEATARLVAFHRRRDGHPWLVWGRYRFVMDAGTDALRIRRLELVGVDGGPDDHPEERHRYAPYPGRRRR